MEKSQIIDNVCSQPSILATFGGNENDCKTVASYRWPLLEAEAENLPSNLHKISFLAETLRSPTAPEPDRYILAEDVCSQPIVPKKKRADFAACQERAQQFFGETREYPWAFEFDFLVKPYMTCRLFGYNISQCGRMIRTDQNPIERVRPLLCLLSLFQMFTPQRVTSSSSHAEGA